MPDKDFPELRIGKELREAITKYLHTEITNSQSGREAVKQTWMDIQRLYEQVDVPEKRDTPFEGAAHVMIPVIATNVELVQARLHSTIYAPEDTYSVTPTRDDLHRFSRATKKWLTWAGENELNEEQVDYSAFLELLKLGTMVQKVIYTQEDELVFRPTPDSTDQEPRYDLIVERTKDHPEFVHVSIRDFFWQMHARCIEESEWTAHRFRVSWNTLRLRVEDGTYKAEEVEKIRNWFVTTQDAVTQEVSDEIGIEPSPMYEFELYEVWFRYPVGIPASQAPTDEGQNVQGPLKEAPIKLKAVFHLDAESTVSIKYNTFPLALDPFEIMPFVGRELQVLGIGVGQMGLPFQIVVTTMHNQRLDNATVVNSVAYKYKTDSRVPNEIPIRPGGGIPVDEMDDLETFQLGQKGDSTLAEEQNTLAMLQERIGVRDLSLEQSALSRAPATTTLALIQEKGRRLDGVLRGIRRFKKRMILKSIMLYKEYYPRSKLLDAFGEEGQLVAEMLDSLSHRQIWNNMGIAVAATTSATSRELEKRSKQEMFNVLLGYYDKYSQFAAGALNPQAPPELRAILIQMGQGLTAFVQELMADFNLSGRREYEIDLQAAIQQAQQLQPAQPAPAEPNGAGAASADVPPAGVQAAPAGTETSAAE